LHTDILITISEPQQKKLQDNHGIMLHRIENTLIDFSFHLNQNLPIQNRDSEEGNKHHLPEHRAITSVNQERNFAGYNPFIAGSTIWQLQHRLHLKMSVGRGEDTMISNEKNHRTTQFRGV
jgi:hypothetical protein